MKQTELDGFAHEVLVDYENMKLMIFQIFINIQ